MRSGELNEFTRCLIVRHLWRALESLTAGSVVMVDNPPQTLVEVGRRNVPRPRHRSVADAARRPGPVPQFAKER